MFCLCTLIFCKELTLAFGHPWLRNFFLSQYLFIKILCAKISSVYRAYKGTGGPRYSPSSYIFSFEFLKTAACCPKRLLHTPSPPLKNDNRLLYRILKIARLLYWVPKSSPKKAAKRQQKITARKVGKKFIPEPVLLLSWNRSKTVLVIIFPFLNCICRQFIAVLPNNGDAIIKTPFCHHPSLKEKFREKQKMSFSKSVR